MGSKPISQDPRFATNHALGLVEEGGVSAQSLLEACLCFLSDDDVWRVLDVNELTPRFAASEGEDR